MNEPDLPQPIARIVIDMHADGKVAALMQGAVSRFYFNAMMETAKQDLLGKILHAERGAGIALPPAGINGNALRGR